ncbi:TELO2-interacting protein 2 isoform X1 [Synchiropus splendidus]|uniref:TELO2-interacting protein 2 isoform X1 n=2 Tax=Synchiropus splendidus TaxID=270530 RepID=UPI00237EC596|nr:TELO2-interacting protein 2 isoform X1 [Synchiropus splendidus]
MFMDQEAGITEMVMEPRPLQSLPIKALLSELTQQLGTTASTSAIGQVELLFQSADCQWLPDQEQWVELQKEYRGLVCALISCADLPPSEDGGAPLSTSDYQHVPVLATGVCRALRALLQPLCGHEGGGARSLFRALAPYVCVFAVTHFQEQLWTSSSSREAARLLLGALLKTGNWRDSAHMLMGDTEDEGLVGAVLDILQPRLTRESWQCCEAAKLVFVWTLLQLTRPFVSPHLARLLGPSLLMNDHHRPENCMLGVRCLHHVVLNTPAADLRQFNQAEVVYQALFRHLYTSEAAVIQLVLQCLLDLLLILERPPSSLASTRRKLCRHDDVLRLVLTHMEAEHKVALRRVYAAALPGLLVRMGLTVCRHLRRLERVLLAYLEVPDPPEEIGRLKVLEALETTIRVAWPRWEGRTGVFVRSLLRLLVDVSSDEQLTDSTKLQLRTRTVACLKLLDVCAQGRVQCLLLQVDSTCCSSKLLDCLPTVWSDERD